MSDSSFANHSLISVVAGAAVLALVFMLLQASVLWYRPRFTGPLLLGALLAALGLLFMIQHWTGSNWLLTAGAFILLASYLSWFVNKPAKTVLSYSKLTLMLSVSSYFLALAWWQAGVPIAAGIGRLFFWAVALLHIYQRWVRRPAPQPE